MFSYTQSENLIDSVYESSETLDKTLDVKRITTLLESANCNMVLEWFEGAVRDYEELCQLDKKNIGKWIY